MAPLDFTGVNGKSSPLITTEQEQRISFDCCGLNDALAPHLTEITNNVTEYSKI